MSIFGQANVVEVGESDELPDLEQLTAHTQALLRPQECQKAGLCGIMMLEATRALHFLRS